MKEKILSMYRQRKRSRIVAYRVTIAANEKELITRNFDAAMASFLVWRATIGSTDLYKQYYANEAAWDAKTPLTEEPLTMYPYR